MKKKYIAVLLCALLFCGLIGCASTEPTQNSTYGSASLLQEATNWFESQTSKYEILSAEAVNDSAIFLTGTKNPDTDEYQLLQVFIVDRTDNSFEVSAWKGAERGLAAGFSVHVLATDSLTVVFGDTFDSIFDFINDKRIDVTFTEARIVFADGESETRSITGNTPYVFALNGVRAVKDVEFISDDLAVKYSDFFSEDLMEASETLDTADLFN